MQALKPECLGPGSSSITHGLGDLGKCLASYLESRKGTFACCSIAELSPESPSLFFWTLTIMVILTNLMVLYTIYLSMYLSIYLF